MVTQRRGARRMADIRPEVLEGLERGELASASLVEWLAIDVRRLLAHVLPALDLDEGDVRSAVEAVADAGIVARTRGIGRALGAATTGRRGARARRALASHPSDAVRCWAAFAVQDEGLDLAERLERARPFAADPHSGVREIAWLAVREALGAELARGLALLRPWTGEADANLRRFAVEATRPRGVWCAHLPALKRDPEPGRPLLEPLAADPSPYVQDSVANWLNDASKDAGPWVEALCARWSAASTAPATARIVRRALRSLRKADR